MGRILDLEYAKLRQTKRSAKYRLSRRTEEVSQAIARFCAHSPKYILDLGTAEGMMLAKIKQLYQKSLCLGIDGSYALLAYGKKLFPSLQFICADIQRLPIIKNNIFDIAIAAAVVEHLDNPLDMLKGVFEVLKNGGIMIITSPQPFWEKIATAVGHLKKGQHARTYSLADLIDLCKNAHFEILETKKIMLSPIGMLLESQIENILRFLCMDFFMANQLVVARKPS